MLKKHKVVENRLRSVIVKSTVTLVLIGLSSWLMVHNWQHRAIFHKKYAFKAEEIKKYRHFPDALYDIGDRLWFNDDAAGAARFFRQAVQQDMFYMDAWLKLAQAEAVLGHPDMSRTILRFSNELTRNIYRWKWEQVLLANELGIKELILGNINFLVKHGQKVQDAFQLFDVYLGSNVKLAIQGLDPDNLIPYLEWLMRWDRAGDAWIVWQKIVENGVQDEDIQLKYIHFLVGQQQVERAMEIRGIDNQDVDGMTNAGFETEITGQGFDWRYTPDQKDQWTIRRTMTWALNGSYSLQVRFEGKENISFGHLYQIVPVDPMIHYRLTFKWQSRDLTTDQGPFVDIYGYDCKGFYAEGPMMLGTNDWQKQDIEFTVPEDCHSVVVRLSRRPSRRFDSKIAGRLWLDEFKLEKVPPPEINAGMMEGWNDGRME